MNNPPKPDMDMTLDPPGSIGIVGAGTHGIEAGLYGRFLGYDVTVLERGSIGNNMLNDSDADLVVYLINAFRPSHCLR